MESTGVPGRIQISRETYERVHDLYEFETREIEAKGKGKLKTYLLKEKHHQNTSPSSERNAVTELLVERLKLFSSANVQTKKLFSKEDENQDLQADTRSY